MLDDMGFGIVEVIAILLGLSGFGLQNNPKAPTVDQALEFAIPDPDLVAHVDAGSFVPNNYNVLTHLADQPQIKSSPELVVAVKQIVGQVEGMRQMAKMATGLDLVSDINDATVFLKFVPGHERPDFVAEIHGNFTPALLDKLAQQTGKQVQKSGSGSLVETGPDTPAVALTGSGVLLAGQKVLLVDRLAAKWHAPKSPQLAYIGETIQNHAVFSLSLTLSAAAKAEITKKHFAAGEKNFATDLLARGKGMSFALYHDGLGIVWQDATKLGADDMAQQLDGFVDLMRAAQIAPRGFAKIVLGALDSYKGNKQVDELIRHKADLAKIMDTFTGDGNFQVKRENANNRASVRVTSKTLSEVLPLGVGVPLLLIGLLTEGHAVKRDEAMPQLAPPPARVVAPPPAKPGTRAPARKTGDPCEGGQ